MHYPDIDGDAAAVIGEGLQPKNLMRHLGDGAVAPLMGGAGRGVEFDAPGAAETFVRTD